MRRSEGYWGWGLTLYCFFFLFLAFIIVIVLSFFKPLAKMLSLVKNDKLKEGLTLRNGSLAFLTFLLVSLSTYFLLT